MSCMIDYRFYEITLKTFTDYTELIITIGNADIAE